MCGQFLAVGDINYVVDKFISNMFIMDSLRGEDSCGLVAVSNEVNTFKRAMSPFDSMDMPQYNKLMNKNNSVIIGHNRKATKGKVNSANAHPFTHGKIVGVHNGTLTNQSLLPDSANFHVDSENIIYSINKIGIEETWKKVAGAAALIWYNAEDATLNVIRNKERPFFFATSSDNKVVFGASEKHMLKCALVRNGINHGKVEALPEDTLYTFKADSLNLKKPVSLTIKKLEACDYRPPATTTYYGYPVGKTYAAGTKIDFQVLSIAEYKHYTNYIVENNNGVGDQFEINDYSRSLNMKVNDFATGLTVYQYNGTRRIDATTVKFDSEYEWADTSIEEDKPADKLKECAWCASPIQEEEKYVTIERSPDVHICESCKYDPLVEEYLVEENVIEVRGVE